MTLMELLDKVSLMEFLLGLIFVVMLLSAILSQKKKVLGVLNKWRKVKNEEDDFNKLVYKTKETVDALEVKVNELTQNRINDRETSKEIRKEMYGDLDKRTSSLQKSIDNLTKIILDMQEKQSKTKRADLKDKIRRIYDECHPAMACTDMQYETLEDLIEEYEAHGGKNSFVHSTVEVEMHSWKKINRIKSV